MPSSLETTLHRLNEVIALAQAGGHNTAVFLLQMASLELRLKAACITDEEFRALLDELESQTGDTDQHGSRSVKLANTAS
jgi:hypothetical protein